MFDGVGEGEGEGEGELEEDMIEEREVEHRISTLMHNNRCAARACACAAREAVVVLGKKRACWPDLRWNVRYAVILVKSRVNSCNDG